MKKIASVRLVFDRKHVATKRTVKKPRLGGIQLEVLYERQRRYFSTGIRVYADEWRGVSPNYIIGRIDMMQLNDTLNQMVHDTMQRITETGEQFDLKSFQNDIKEGKTEEYTFLEFMRSRIADRALRPSTKRQHNVIVTMLEEYGKIIRFGDLSQENILKFDDWVHRRVNKEGEKICQATVHGIHKRLKVYVREAFLRGYITKNPYDYVKIQKGKSKDRTYLTEEELQRLVAADMPTDSTDDVRDLAVFQAFTGLAYSDLSKFDWRKAEKRGEHWFVTDVRQKTGETFQFLLLTPAMQVLEKHDFCLPSMSQQQYNMRLKVVMDAAKINKTISSHCLRHTFAIYALNAGMAIEVVGKILGQKKISTTQIYAKLLGKTIEDAMKKLDRKAKKITPPSQVV